MLAESLPGPQVELDLTDIHEQYLEETIEPEDLSLIAMPVYGGRAPVLAMERFRKLQGNGSRCLLIAVYGNRDYEDTLVEMQDAAENCNFHVIGAVAAIAEHSVVHQYACGRPDALDREALHQIGRKLLQPHTERSVHAVIPGNRPYTKPMSLSLVPKLTKNCINCGKCRENCPAGAIDHSFIADKKKCISCMRCVSICPAGARKPNSFMVSLSALVLKKDCSTRKNISFFRTE